MHMHTAGFLVCHQLNFALQAHSLFDTFMSYFVGYSLIVLGAKIWQGDDIKDMYIYNIHIILRILLENWQLFAASF